MRLCVVRLVLSAIAVVSALWSTAAYAQPATGDIRITGVSAFPSSVNSGGSITLTVTVRNFGPGNGQLLWAQARPQGVPGASFVRVSPFETIALNGTRSYAIGLTMPTLTPGSGAVSYPFEVQIQEAANIGTGNSLINASGVTVTAPPLPDLFLGVPSGWDRPIVVSDIQNATTTPVALPSGVPIYLNYSVTNQGGITPAGIPMRARLFNTDTGGQTTLSVPTPLAPIAQGLSTINRNFVLPAAFLAAGGNYRVVVEIDPDQLVPESNRGNNGAERLFFVTPPAIPPIVTQQPARQTPCPGGTATFSVGATGSAPLSFRWRRNTVQIPTTGPGSNASAATPTLTLSGVHAPDAGSYDCVVTNAGGSATSNPAALIVCQASFTCAGQLTVGDIFAFLSIWFANGPGSDFNNSGIRDVSDIFAFLSAWFAGC